MSGCVHTWIVCVFVCLHVFVLVYVYLCVCLNEWALSGAAPCCASCIWSHLCWGSVGGGDDFNVLEPQTDLSQTVVSMKARQLGPVKLNRLIWVVSKRQTLWLHSNPRSDSLGNPPADWYTQTLETVCFNDRRDVFYIRGHPHLFLAVRVVLPTFCNSFWVYFLSVCQMLGEQT